MTNTHKKGTTKGKGLQNLFIKRINKTRQIEMTDINNQGNELPPLRSVKFSRQEGWKYNATAQFPWRIERIVHEESNWRGTWRLEAKDKETINWQMVVVPRIDVGLPGGNKSQQEWPPKASSSTPKQGWNRMAEFPWTLNQVLQETDNWRVTWVLQVKDMLAMNWGTEFVRSEDNKRRRKIQRKPTQHLPFTPERQPDDDWPIVPDGGQDDLMVWLGKP
ncbi:hypothetical protein QBC38DRAFT_490015 [Podospora fimiseda]|uniref:Uncharacterized protein n=1 Tax=Podospora fimiseda TaxID=252190 RepID=A0AAN6YTD5_9PEZI|nr:hypothetical protein QBC38DRAFT_490015 [Podospora fimiseda]